MLADVKDDVALVCDDDAHRVVLYTSSHFLKSFLVESVLTDVKDNYNVTLACHCDAHKVCL